LEPSSFQLINFSPRDYGGSDSDSRSSSCGVDFSYIYFLLNTVTAVLAINNFLHFDVK
jgi:hypothetical protein